MRPEVALVVGSPALAGEAERLAGVAADEEVDGLDPLPAGGLEVAVIGDAWPPFSKDERCVSIDLRVPRGAPHAGPLEAEGEPVDP